MKGVVIKSTGSWYIVRDEKGMTYECRIKGRFRMEGMKATNPVAVGDFVEIENNIITALLDRKNYIIRKATNLSRQSHIIAANIDQAFLLVTLASPKTSFGFIDRFLLTAEAYRIPTILIFNKEDIFEADESLREELKSSMSIYEKIGYSCYNISSLKMKNSDKEKMISLLKNKTTLLAGHSGVGKSTFVNSIEPTLNLKVGKISQAHLKGTHTTTFAEMHPLSFGGFIVDTPGIKEFGLYNVEKNELFHFFPEIFSKAKECNLSNCLHINEPKCAVIDAVEKNEIALSRYQSYLGIMQSDELEKTWQKKNTL